MASAVDIAPNLTNLRIKWIDEADETGTVNILLDGATTDADLGLIVDDFAALSNALITKVDAIRAFPITGFAIAGKPAVAAQPLIASILSMEFNAPNPRNELMTVTKQVPLPAYINAIRNDSVKPHAPVTDNATLNDLTAKLAANLVFVDKVTNDITVGGWVFNTGSKFGTKLTVTDGL